MPDHPTIAAVELVWTVVCLCGVAVALVTGRLAWGDYRTAQRHGDAARRLVARRNLRGEVLKGVAKSVWASIGLVALALPPQPPGGVLSQGLAGALVISVALLITDSLLSLWDRRTLDQLP